MKFAVLGAGAWGTALSQVLADNKHETVLYSRDLEITEEINSKHTNSQYFGKDVLISKDILATSSLQEALKETDAVVFAVPSNSYRDIISKVNPLLSQKIYVVTAAKGLDPQTYERLSDLIRDLMPENKRYPVVSLIGPSFANEVILRMLTSLTATCLDMKTAEIIQRAFSNDYFRVYANTDEIGAEYGCAIKNVIAIAAGILAGAGYGDNARAAIITRGLAEMTRFGVALGARPKTYLGLTGLGDLTLTCSSHQSRNFMAGFQIGKDDSADNFLMTNKNTVEGIETSKVIFKKALSMGIDMPIVSSVYSVLFLKKKPSEMIKTLMGRALKPEF